MTALLEEATPTQRTRGGLARLYELHAARATRLAYLLTGDLHLAQDITQEAFVKLAGRFRHLRSQEAFGPYLSRAVVNLCNDTFRRRKLERAYVQREMSQAEEAMAPADLDTRSELFGALRVLPDRQRAAIVLRYYEDLSVQQLADVLDCSPGAAKSLLTRGLESLRKHMEANDGI